MNEEQLRRMIAFVGYGDFKRAKIIFFGNEEGTAGGTNLLDEINRRCYQYFNEGIPIVPENPEDGFYTPQQNINDDNVFMLQFQARLLLHLNDPEVDWFQSAPDRRARFELIKLYQAYLLYKEDSPLNKSALFDLCPLPRANGKAWHYDEPNLHLDFSQKQYDKAFSYLGQIDPGNPCIELSLQRAEVIKRLLNKCRHAKILIGIGKKEVKKRFLTQTFNNPHFDPLDLSGSICYHTVLEFKRGRSMHVFLCDFFNNQQFNLQNLQALAETIYPLR